MFFEPSVWDWILIAMSAYVAVTALIYMMREYQKKMIVQLKTTLLKRQMAEKSRQEEADEVGF
ncbi:MAG: hypothetical protein Q8M16_18215 [Pirellulaceae bacterium]|nr:hypothetical protein [Pirellulaceae bacterium]